MSPLTGKTVGSPGLTPKPPVARSCTAKPATTATGTTFNMVILSRLLHVAWRTTVLPLPKACFITWDIRTHKKRIPGDGRCSFPTCGGAEIRGRARCICRPSTFLLFLAKNSSNGELLLLMYAALINSHFFCIPFSHVLRSYGRLATVTTLVLIATS